MKYEFQTAEAYPEELRNKFREDAAERLIGIGDIRVMFFTCDRTQQPGIQRRKKLPQGENYIHQTLSSLYMSDPLSAELGGVDLMLGNEHRDYLDHCYRHTDKVTIHPAPEGLNDRAKTPHQKLLFNYIRTIKAALEVPYKGYLICEDDIVFRDGFWGCALDSINELRCMKVRQEGNTISFYSMKRYVGRKSFYRGLYVTSGGGAFAGLCGIYYDRECLEDLLNYLVSKYEAGKGRPADMMFTDWSNKRWTRYVSPRGLIQHIGGVSSGTSAGKYWTNPSFDEELKCWYPGWEERPYEHFYMRAEK